MASYHAAPCSRSRELRGPIPCPHPAAWISQGIVYEYCDWCGAVRKPERPGWKGFDWHLCHDCKLPGWDKKPPEMRPE
jgi:hypothetical protein